MPQGVIIAITPDKFNKECEGKVEVLEGQHKGEILPFKQNKCCDKKKGDTVEIDILEGGKGGGRRAKVKC